MSTASGIEQGSFDYVIVGSGAAGSILANRLSADPSVSVCLLEAGPSDWHPFLHMPAGYIKKVFDPNFTFPFTSEPTEHTGGRRIPVPQGRTLGGSTAINGLVYNRGQAQDFDDWAAAGNPGWSYQEILPYFKATETRIGEGDDTYRGRTGPMPITNIDWIHPISEAFIKGAQELGMPRNPDYNGATQAGVGYFQRNIYRGYRMSAARSFLKPVRSRSNLTVLTKAHASKILFEEARAVGIQYIRGGKGGATHVVRARREVILSAGALNTPKLLQLSGIGPAALLNKLGIPVFRDMPGVGHHLKDHFSIRVVAKVKGIVTINELARAPRLWGQITRWLLKKPSILALSPSLLHFFWQSRQGLTRPDLQGVFTPASYREGYVGMLDKYPGMTCGVWQHRPESMGYIHAQSTDPFEAPLVQPNYLDHENDRRVLIDGMRLARELLKTQPLAQYSEGESMPGVQVERDDEMMDYIRRYGVSSYHLNGSARMGPKLDPANVVDAQLRVHGLEGLRVVDASVMPNIVSANTNASTMMIAEKAASMILKV
jgi:choline dehydrogenase